MKIKIWGWGKKERTMLRFLKPGDIFCFLISDKTFSIGLTKEVYGFGRLIAKSKAGHVAEIFDFFSNSPDFNELLIEDFKRVCRPLILDSYVLFDRKMIGDWRIIGRHEDYEHRGDEDVFFVWGDPSSPKKSDIYGNSSDATEEEFNKYPFKVTETDDSIKAFYFTEETLDRIRAIGN
ncbi:Imm26 family immunity protein [Oceanospirillum beijerinckii]|uniref:Imm26 family immunity protein n=1 Tax=Oceanospirillum beijerinckii TaxID=64976 RepID=UPI000685E2F0|nr:Imm26 family immunity protein [Oceanospirillum beijerinckii]